MFGISFAGLILIVIAIVYYRKAISQSAKLLDTQVQKGIVALDSETDLLLVQHHESVVERAQELGIDNLDELQNKVDSIIERYNDRSAQRSKSRRKSK